MDIIEEQIYRYLYIENGMECNICYENKQELFKCNRCIFICCPKCLINFILMKKANVQCVGYVDNILLVKKALISVFYHVKMSYYGTMLCCM